MSWSTRKDILKDLKTGGINDSGILIGDRPPPKINYDEDDEILNHMEYFGHTNLMDGSGDNAGYIKPDLEGISNMLRMVNIAEEERYNGLRCNTPSFNLPSTTIMITKLNPNVSEFKPNKGGSGEKSLEIDGNETSSNSGTVKKQKIESPYKTKNKRKIKPSRNVAMSSLLQIQEEADEKRKEQLKLSTPNYFLNQEPVKEEVADDAGTKKIDEESNVNNSTLETHEQPKSLNAYINQSIDKVNDWFQKPVNNKVLDVHMGPVIFRRKSPQSNKAPSNEKPIETNTKAAKSDEYVPSELSKTLLKVYEERSKQVAQPKEAKLVNLDTSVNELILQKLEEKETKKAAHQS